MHKLLLAFFVIIFFGCGGGGNNSNNDSTLNSIPYNATAKCVDGSYSVSTNCIDSCFNHGGVTQWMSYLISCGDGTTDPIRTNDIPTINILNVQPSNIAVRSQMPFNQNITFGVSAYDNAGIKYMYCNIFKSDGSLVSGSGWDFTPPIGVNNNVNKSVTIGISTEVSDIFTLKCGVNDISANSAITTKTITVQ